MSGALHDPLDAGQSWCSTLIAPGAPCVKDRIEFPSAVELGMRQHYLYFLYNRLSER